MANKITDNPLGHIVIERKVRRYVEDMYRTHSHFFNELFFLNSGARRQFINNNIYDVLPGDLIIIPKGILHKTTSIDNSGFDRYCVYFDDNVIARLKAHIGDAPFDSFFNSECLVLPESDAKIIKQKLDFMHAEKGVNDMYSPAICENLLCDIILCAMRNGTKKALKSGSDIGQIQQAIKYINANFAENITLKDVASVLHMEETYFSKKFKQLTGLGFKEFLIQTRIKKAEELLAYTDFGIAQISEKCGFASSNYFGDAFKRINGMSPRQYRKLF